MGEKLQWAVKNGDLEAVKAIVEKVWEVLYVFCVYCLRIADGLWRIRTPLVVKVKECALRLLSVGIRGRVKLE